MMHMTDAENLAPPTNGNKPTVYTHPFTGVPVGKYVLHTKGQSSTTVQLDVTVELNQHGDLYVLYDQRSGSTDEKPPHRITALTSDALLKPRAPSGVRR
jgi:hypothetical protein